jgi:hypothetical protein
MIHTPHDINSLAPNQVFVFGSNTAGVHGKGAARTAAQLFGARRGVSEGLSGQSYAIPTRRYEHQHFTTLPLDEIAFYVSQFLGYAVVHPEKQFLVTLIGCGYAGYQPRQIAPMFKGCPGNVILPVEFV